MGTLISIDEGTLNPGSFDRALFQIITNCPTRVEDSLNLKVGERMFTVYVSEFEPRFSPESIWEDSPLMKMEVASPSPTVGDLVGVSPVQSSELVACVGLSSQMQVMHEDNQVFRDGSFVGGGECSEAENVSVAPCSEEVWARERDSSTLRSGADAHGLVCQGNGTHIDLVDVNREHVGFMVDLCDTLETNGKVNEVSSNLFVNLIDKGDNRSPGEENIGAGPRVEELWANDFSFNSNFPSLSSGTAGHDSGCLRSGFFNNLELRNGAHDGSEVAVCTANNGIVQLQVGPNSPLDGSNSKAFDDSIRSVDYFKHVDLSISKLLLENHVVNAFEGHYSPCDNPVFKGNSKVVEELKNMHVGSVVALDVALVENAFEGSFTPLDSSSNKGFVVGSNVELVSSRNVDEGPLSKSLVGAKFYLKLEKKTRSSAEEIKFESINLLSDLSGTSISDSVLKQRWVEAFIEAHEAMYVDRQLRLMVGSPEMVVL
ncbi:hypothetical protein F3Y22_tig00000340pilonHSYRG00758 [Hibiscus syriacus]|uniref:Uncharacterized protein n=1 Tax=Hibiscus syriacus TaxID=106335 RepID=A0A6A3D2A8_HIBSY|nr:hypothetical protein F3Y22_tig00000340pilonHSYRG00758 [Hibiscus syriacus]